MQNLDKLKKISTKLPDAPGVYFFLDKNNQKIYVGKATSLKNRVRSYLSPKIGEKRSPLIERMVGEAVNIKFEKTDSVLEALLLESELIKKLNPKYNSADKDQKSFNYVVITEEDFPRVLVVRERELQAKSLELKASFGPFPHGGQLKEALKIVRKIFPFRDQCVPSEVPYEQLSERDRRKSEGIFQQKNTPVVRKEFLRGKPKACFNRQIGLCPGVCTGEISKKEYAKTISHIKKFFQGKKKELIKDLEREMKLLAKVKKFEEASNIKFTINSLKHINDIAIIKRDKDGGPEENTFRIEAYDISHISGTNMVGVMTVVEGSEANKNEYRLFKIKNQKIPDDTKALGEILERRFKHSEWRLPDIVVVDGSTAQINTAEEIIKNIKEKNIALFAVTKDERHKAKEIKLGNKYAKSMLGKHDREIILANSEAHRFAISFHKKLRNKGFLPPQ